MTTSGMYRFWKREGGVTFWSSRIFHKGSGRRKLVPQIHVYSSDPLSAHELFSLRGFDVWVPGVPSINFISVKAPRSGRGRIGWEGLIGSDCLGRIGWNKAESLKSRAFDRLTD